MIGKQDFALRPSALDAASFSVCTRNKKGPAF
jgi:hypothetical protein